MRWHTAHLIKSLISEVKAISGSIREMIEYQQLFEEAKTVKPLMGSFINRILCYYESEVLQVMINFLNKNNMKSHVFHLMDY